MESIKLTLNGNIVITSEEVTYKSTIQDIQEDSVLINVPIGKGAFLYLEPGHEIEMNYFDGTGYYIFDTKFIEREKDSETKIPLYRVTLPYNVRKIQRRDFVRVDFVDYIYLKSIDRKEETAIKVLMLNISGGGMKFCSEINFEQYELVSINLRLNDSSYILKGKIARVCNLKRGKETVYGVQFIDIKESVRELIIQKVFSQMRKQRNSI